MSLSTTPRSKTLLRLMARRPAAINLAFLKQDDQVLNLTGATVVLTIANPPRKGGTLVLTKTATTVDLALGLVRLDVQGDELNIDPSVNYPYVITLTSAEGYKSTVVQGEIDIEANPDLTVPVDYTTVAAPLALTVELLANNNVTVKVNHHPDSVLLAFQNAAAAASGTATTAAGNAAVSQVAAAASAAVATTEAQTAASAAVAAQTSATNAAGSATSAANSAAAAGSATTSANAAAASATAAASSATAAGTSATAADTDAAAAAASAASAAASATAAGAIRTVAHGNNANVARPDAAIIHWVGAATPVNAISTDFLTKVTI